MADDEALQQKLHDLDIQQPIEIGVNNKESGNEFEWVLWTGGSWECDWDTACVHEYKGNTLVKHALKLPSKNLTFEVLKNHVRAIVGLSMEEELELTYTTPSSVNHSWSNIVDDLDFMNFMDEVDTLQKPVTLYAGGFSRIQVPIEKVGVIIGKEFQTMEKLETQSGAILGLRLNNVARSKELILEVIGDGRQIKMVKEMIQEVMDQEEVYEVEILLFSGGDWDYDSEPMEYKGESVMKHVLKLPSNFTPAVLESHVKKELSLSVEDGFYLSFPVFLHSSAPRKFLPTRLLDDLDFVQFLGALGKPRPMTLYVHKVEED